MDVWTPTDYCKTLSTLASESCIHFVRWLEQGKFPKEVIYDRPPYAIAV